MKILKTLLAIIILSICCFMVVACGSGQGDNIVFYAPDVKTEVYNGIETSSKKFSVGDGLEVELICEECSDIFWNEETSTINISAFAPAGEYNVKLTATNDKNQKKDIDYKVVVNDYLRPSIRGKSQIVLTEGYALTEEAYTISGTNVGVSVIINEQKDFAVYDKETNKLQIKEGLPVGEYYLYLKCSNNIRKADDTSLVVKVIVLSSDLQIYKPVSPTITMYETEGALTYGFTWNSEGKPVDPFIKIKKASEESYSEYSARTNKYQTYTGNTKYDYYVSKVEIELLPDTQYEYVIGDRALEDVNSGKISFTSCNPQSNSFSFASLSDTQNSDNETGVNLNKIFKSMSDVDFYLHSGDICEDTKHEANWTAMLDSNKEFLAKKPMMVAAGNHDTVYKSGYNEVFKHFNNNISNQDTKNGYYYSFVYGNAKFVVINTNSLTTANKLTSKQYTWLENELKTNEQQWLIVMMHNPLYSIGKYGNQNTTDGAISKALREQLAKLFADNKVDLVIQGHDHECSKTNPISYDEQNNEKINVAQKETIEGIEYSRDPNGTIYIMNGPSGSQIRQPEYSFQAELYEYTNTNYSKANSWAEYTIEGNKLIVRVMYFNERDGEDKAKVLHEWGIIKTESTQQA